MDIVKSLRPLILSLNPTSANTLFKLRNRRMLLTHEVTELINTLGPEMFPDFDSTRIIADPFRDPSYVDPTSSTRWDYIGGESGSPTEPKRVGEFPSSQGHLPRNESFHDLANIGFFSTRPPSRSRSRSSSGGGLAGSGGLPLKAFSSLDSQESFAEVSKRIRGAMKERGQERRRRSEDGSWDMSSSGAQTPCSQEGKKDL